MKCLIIMLCAVLISSEDVAEQEGISANHLFTSDLYKTVITGNDFMVSPFSVERLLALAHSGCKGETAEQLRNSLHLPESHEQIEAALKATLPKMSNEQYTFRTVNKIYLDKHFPIKEEFKGTAAHGYSTDSEIIDFKNKTEVKRLKKWVHKHTDYKIKSVNSLNHLNDRPRAVLLNALYFETKWSDSLLESTTRDAFFYESSSKDGEVSMAEVRTPWYQLSTFIRPDQIFDPHRLQSSNTNSSSTNFKIETTTNFKDKLRRLGVENIFNAREADLSGIAGEKGDLIVNEVVQKTFIRSYDNGVKAAAVTYFTITDPVNNTLSKLRKTPKFFSYDPMIFYIKVRNVTIFAGNAIQKK